MVKGMDRVRTPVDAFILQKLEGRGWTLSKEADRYALIRRVSLDLTGLLPSLEEIDRWIADDSLEGYERLVDGLMASPHYGERWGRHWLDWAGYVDVLGGDNDAGRIKLGEGKWLYRDYVVRSLNEDKPFDRFLEEQLAGDELVDWRNASKFDESIRQLLVATGYLRTASDDTDEDELNTSDVRHGVLQRTGEMIANNLLGLTLQCAKCHDHKYEPISQVDYYKFLANFSPAFNPDHWLQPPKRALPDVSAAEKAAMDRHNQPLDDQIKSAREEQSKIRQGYRERLIGARLEQVAEDIREEVRQAIAASAEKRTGKQKELAGRFEKQIVPKAEEIESSLGAADRKTVVELESMIQRLTRERRVPGTLQAVYDVGAATPFRLLQRGDHLNPGPEVPAGYPAVLCAGVNEAKEGRAEGVAGETSGRRLALARWLVEQEQLAAGLMARVFVNRVWHQLFGRGIVETTDNLGRSGAEPTHPELLDWLAAEFMGNGWRIKPIIKLMVISSVYRQGATSDLAGGGEARAVGEDSDNRWLWRQRVRRLESEIIRDAMLCASGQLDSGMTGAPAAIKARPDGMVVIPENEGRGRYRRSLYVLARRNYHLSFLNTFDQPAVATSCIRRTPSAVVLQSLALLNDPFVLEQSERMARRVAGLVPGNETAQVELAFKLALTRPPDDEELKASVRLLGQGRGDGLVEARKSSAQSEGTNREAGSRELEGLAQLCHALLSANEFLYAP